jgi:GNAT superfamily N-acetyltransferase
LLDTSAEVTARCSLWWQATPAYPGRQLGFIGHYAAHDAQAAGRLLDWACRQLAAHRCTLAVGPVDGSTWQRYRLRVERGAEPDFFLEPNNPDDWPCHFTANGFQLLAHYSSTLNTNLAQANSGLAKVAQRAAARGIHIRPFDPDRFDEELGRLYRLALTSFSRNFLYSPIDEANFMALYRPLRPYIRPELILLAEREAQPIGFIFALPDLLQAQRGLAIDTLIIKTVAVRPDHQTHGLGSLLVARCQEMAHQLGYHRTIHALMHEKNDSRKISQRNETRLIRRYALFAKAV